MLGVTVFLSALREVVNAEPDGLRAGYVAENDRRLSAAHRGQPANVQWSIGGTLSPAARQQRGRDR